MMTEEAEELLNSMLLAANKEELLSLIAENINRCDSLFFAAIGRRTEQLISNGNLDSARKIKELGDNLARLRLML